LSKKKLGRKLKLSCQVDITLADRKGLYNMLEKSPLTQGCTLCHLNNQFDLCEGEKVTVSQTKDVDRLNNIDSSWA